MKKPLKVGITGGIGAGKTIVSRIFSLLNVPVYNADDRAKWLMQNDKTLKLKIAERFGKEAFLQDGNLNRTFLAKKVFGDETLTKEINALVHPVVQKDFEEWHKLQDSAYVLKEAALLFETSSYKKLDQTIHVTAPLPLRISRVLKRDAQRSEEQVHQIVSRQLTDQEKDKLADHILKNDDLQMVIPQVLVIHERLKAMQKK